MRATTILIMITTMVDEDDVQRSGHHGKLRGEMRFGPQPDAITAPTMLRVERRRKPRIASPYPATVRGIDATGDRFEVNTAIDNISANGLCLRLACPVKKGAKLFVVVRLSTVPPDHSPAPSVAIRGVVLRVEALSDGYSSFAVAFMHHRFLYASETQ